MKKYTAQTAISVSVGLPDGGNARVSFSALSDGRSVYYTDDEEIQWGLEHHYKYGKLFRLEESVEVRATGKRKKALKAQGPRLKAREKREPETEPEEDTEENEETADSGEAGESNEAGGQSLREVTVTDMDDAKDYLADNFGVVRTKMKSEEIINATAQSYGIIFKTL